MTSKQANLVHPLAYVPSEVVADGHPGAALRKMVLCPVREQPPHGHEVLEREDGRPVAARVGVDEDGLPAGPGLGYELVHVRKVAQQVPRRVLRFHPLFQAVCRVFRSGTGYRYVPLFSSSSDGKTPKFPLVLLKVSQMPKMPLGLLDYSSILAFSLLQLRWVSVLGEGEAGPRS